MIYTTRNLRNISVLLTFMQIKTVKMNKKIIKFLAKLIVHMMYSNLV